jgi:hypothetical protein
MTTGRHTRRTEAARLVLFVSLTISSLPDYLMPANARA